MRKREPRRRVMLPARLRAPSGWTDVSIRNISSRGMLLHGMCCVPAGTYVEVRRDMHTIVGRIVWQKGTSMGLYTQDRLDVDAIVGRPPQPQQRRTDEPQYAEPRPRSAAMTGDTSRQRSAIMQFVFIALTALTAAIMIGAIAHRALTAPSKAIGQALAGAQPPVR
jgi:hypothetical protein